ncbi:MAG: tetratricopeptide repeat protein [Bacteroidetes bacterium]|jgi:tetratricopeptide (TPR) repeat protein|nr:tetratricopeptide repeat protein [Bacteroidota bacterium]MBL0080657.1 tetratricopeptide repeat protein [Bacteroidota bacterium]MBL0287024.1 tetratricopeptide repeat protein [Bacteroidota bacterium]
MRKLLFFILSIVSINLFAQKAKVNSAKYALETGDVKGAKKLIDEAVANPEGALMAKAWMTKGDVYTAIYTTQVLFTTFPTALFDAEEAYKKGHDLEEKKKDEYSPKLTDLSGFLRTEGANLFDKKMHDEAFKYLAESSNLNKWMMEKGLAKDFDTIVAIYAGHAAYYAKKPNLAIPFYEEVIYKYNTDDESPYSILIDLYNDMGAKDKSFELTQKARTKFPNNKEFAIAEINHYLETGETDNVISKIKSSIELDPNNHTFYFVLGSAYDNIKKSLDEKIKSETDVSKATDLKKASENNYTLAKEAYKKAISIKPDYNDAYFNMGAMVYNEAIILNKKMNDEKNMKLYNAMIPQRDALYQEALPYLEKSYELNPNDRATIQALKEMYARMGMDEKYEKMPK